MKLKREGILVGAIVIGLLMGCSSVSDLADGDITDMSPDDMAADLQDQAQERAEAEVEDRADAAQAEVKIRATVQSPHRSDENTARDEYRNPVDTLTFFGVAPDQRLIELMPGESGWYAEILAPLIASEGTYTAASPHIEENASGDEIAAHVPEEYQDQFEQASTLVNMDNIQLARFAPGDAITLGEPGSADTVLTFRNLHSLYNGGHLEEALAAVEEVLVPGGVFGVVQHRAPEGSDPEETAPKGYLPEAFVIETIEAAGFVLEETSEVNANPMDTADHEDGVWALPPTLRGGEETAEQFKEIGESDRMTLRFVKPEDADAGEVAADDDAE